MKRFFFSSVAITVATMPFGLVQAQTCVVSGTDVTCSAGAINAPFSSADDALNVTIEPNATVLAPSEDALELDGVDATVTNDGAITSQGNRGIDAEDGLTLFNGRSGDDPMALRSVVSTTSDAVRGGDDLTIRNFGDINGGDEAVQAGDRADIVNKSIGVIQATDKGIQVGDDLSLVNRGQILSGDEGVEADDGADITNSGTIFAFEDAVQVQSGATITNSGSILSSGGRAPGDTTGPFTTDGDGVDIDDGSIFNNGSGSEIIAANGAGIDFDGNAPEPGDPDGTGDALIYNEGTIRGVQGILVETVTNVADDQYANTSSQNVINYGTIEGTGGTALNLGGGDDTLLMYDMSVVKGEALFGEGSDTLYLASLEYSSDGWEELFDGGADEDDIRFAFGLSRLIGVEDTGAAIRLILASFDGPLAGSASAAQPETFDVLLSNFETASFADGSGGFVTISLAAAIPLPASILALGAGLAGLGALRRRRR